MSSRTYSEKEATELFRRAAEMQASDAHPDAPGLTLDELKRAGRAAGIAPAYLDRALAAPTTTSHEPTRLLRLQTSVHRQRFVPHPVEGESWGRIVRDLREHLGGQGATETLGGVHEWRRNPLRFVAEPVDGGTVLRASASWHGALQRTLSLVIAVPFFLITAWGESMGGNSKGVLVLGVLAVMIAALVYFGLRGYFGKAERVGAKFDDALDRAAQRLADADLAPAPLTDHADALAHPDPQITLETTASLDSGAAGATRLRSRA